MNRRPVRLLLVFLVLFTGCTSRKKPAEPKETAPAVTLGNLHFFLETSASMGGYLRGATEFKDVVSDVVSKANAIKPVKIWTISEKAQAYSGDARSFVANLATTPLATGKSSRLHTIFEQVGKQAARNDIVLLASDCILSFPDEDIRSNPEINRENASSVLKNQIYDQFSRLSRQGIGATVYAFRSRFNGTYYDYQNAKHTLNGEMRPFYVWVIGKQELLPDFNRQLREALTTQPAQVLDFGKGGAISQYVLFFSLNKQGKWRVERNNLTKLTARPGHSETFAIGLDLSGLPAYAQAADHLRKNLVINSKDAAVKLVNVQRREEVTATRLSEREEKLLNGVSHVLTFQVDNLFGDAADLNLRLPVRFDTWYEREWTTMDDRTPAGRQNKTFALNHLMNGVREAYQSAGNAFVDVKLRLEK